MPTNGHVEFILPEEGGPVCSPFPPFLLASIEAARTDSGAVIRFAGHGGWFVIIDIDSQTAERLGAELRRSLAPSR